MPASSLNWFEIPAADFERAVKFYTDIGIPITVGKFREHALGFLPAEQGGIGGAIVGPDYFVPAKTGAEGPLVYLNARDDMVGILSRVEGAGGNILMPRTDIAPQGFMAVITDSEENRVGLHSMT